MEHLPKKIHQNGISYTLVGDYYIPDLKLPEESRPIGRWGRMQEAEGVTEELKARDQLAWVGTMNSIRSRAEEIILSEMIFV